MSPVASKERKISFNFKSSNATPCTSFAVILGAFQSLSTLTYVEEIRKKKKLVMASTMGLRMRLATARRDSLAEIANKKHK